jgi:sugar phosphate isomerase/epimerase
MNHRLTRKRGVAVWRAWTRYRPRDQVSATRWRDVQRQHGEGVFPLAAVEYDYAPFFAALRTIKYDGRISVEASTKELAADAPPAIAFLRRSLQ